MVGDKHKNLSIHNLIPIWRISYVTYSTDPIDEKFNPSITQLWNVSRKFSYDGKSRNIGKSRRPFRQPSNLFFNKRNP